MDEPPLVVQAALAKAIGLNEAIVLQQVHYWLEQNRRLQRNVIEGRVWTYNSVPEWLEQFSFWSDSGLRKIVNRLKARGLIETAQLSADKRDRTLYYTIDYARLHLLLKDTSICYAVADASIDNVADVYKEQRLATETTTETKNTSPPKSGGACEKLLDLYNLHRGKLPAVTILNAKRKRQLTRLVKEFGDDTHALLRDATKNVASDGFWIERGYNLDNLLASEKVVEKAEKQRAAEVREPAPRTKITARDVLRESGYDPDDLYE